MTLPARWFLSVALASPGRDTRQQGVLHGLTEVAWCDTVDRFKKFTRYRQETFMPITEINHYFVRANNLEETRQFYMEALGFEQMHRPDFPFPGYWLGTNGKIQVHMGPHDIPNKPLYYLGTPNDARTDQSGVVDHIAFLATDPEAFSHRFKKMGLNYRPRYFPEFKLFQYFVKDPNGLMIELNFFNIEDASAWMEEAEDYSKMARVEEIK
jgi:catechol 2,3-dioxygenase-like lactoylglutathione lyase family enzyme